MLPITISTIGHLKDSFYRDTEAHYKKLLTRFSKLDIQELNDVKISTQSRDEVIKIESQTAAASKKSQTYTVVLEKGGKTFDSLAFANWLQQKQDSGTSLQFFIGGPYGFSEEFVHSCNEKISLSAMTFPHQLARILLLEQLYRGFTIFQNVKYHY